MAAQHHHATQWATRVPVCLWWAAPPGRLYSKDLRQLYRVRAFCFPPWHPALPIPSANLAAPKSLPPTFG
jgi:hypothetical protein